jgi:hypothetical protein
MITSAPGLVHHHFDIKIITEVIVILWSVSFPLLRHAGCQQFILPSSSSSWGAIRQMSSGTPRFIVVDNVDPSIQYTGPWFLNQGSENSVGNFGPPFQATLHGVQANASLSFPFNGEHYFLHPQQLCLIGISGSQIRVIGTNNIRNDSGVLDPTWQCFIDGISIGASAPFAFPENNWVFCNQDSLVDGPHILTVNATVLKNQTFWFDNIQYAPSASVPLNEAVIMVDHLDSQLQYGTGWEALGTTANMTLVAGSTFNFNFIGMQLIWPLSLSYIRS